MNNHPKIPSLVLQNVSRHYGDIQVLEEASFGIMPGEVVALLGPSGSGKSSLLHVAGLLEPPTAGEIFICGQPTSKLNDTERTRIRRDQLGFVYQFHHLLPEFNALTNVMLPLLIAGHSKKKAKDKTVTLLTDLGLKERLSHQPAQLSGGEKQRVAIARAMIHNPKLLLADEPTGNLDVTTSERVFDALIKTVRQRNSAALIATHDRSLAQRMDRTIAIHNRKLVRIKLREAPAPRLIQQDETPQS